MGDAVDAAHTLVGDEVGQCGTSDAGRAIRVEVARRAAFLDLRSREIRDGSSKAVARYDDLGAGIFGGRRPERCQDS